MSDNKYKSAAGFRAALESRLQDDAKAGGLSLDYVRKFTAFEAFLKRISVYGGNFENNAAFRVVLKGGYAMYKRYGKVAAVRPTKDLDFVMRRLLADVAGEVTEYEKLVRYLVEDVCKIDVGDYFTFLVSDSQKDLEAAGVGGWRFSLDARLAGRSFVKFHIDMCLGDALMENTEKVTLGERFEFAGLSSIEGELLSEAQHFAEKLHALSRELEEGQNTRVKDLVDLVIMIKNGSLDQASVAAAAVFVFDHRQQHSMPPVLPRPNPNWEPKFTAMIQELGLDITYRQALVLVDAYYDELQSIIDASRRPFGGD